MARYTHLFPGFNGGEMTPKLRGRTDSKSYVFGCEQIENFIPLPQGPITRRPGTKFLMPTRFTTTTRLIPFEEDIDSSFMLEFGNGYMRVFKDKSAVLVDNSRVTNTDFATNITGWTDSSNGTGSIAWDAGDQRMNLVGVGSGNEAIASQQISSLNTGTTLYKIEMDVFDGPVTVNIGASAGSSSIATGTLTAGTDQSYTFLSTASSFYISIENSASSTVQVDNISLTENYQITTPYGTSDISDLQWGISGSTMIITHPSYEPRMLTLTTDTSWSIDKISNQNGPYFDAADTQYGGTGTGITLTPSATTGTITMTASSPLFVSTDVGRLVRFRHLSSAEWGWGKISVYNSGTSVDVILSKDLSSTTASTEWVLGAWSDTTGWPRCVTFFEDRVVFAATAVESNRFWGSVSGSLNDFQPDSDNQDTLAATSAYSYTATAINTIVWLTEGLRLFVGATNGIFTIRGGGNTGITPTTPPEIRTATQSGAATALPARTQNTTIYPHTSQKKLMELSYVYEEEEGFRATDMAAVADQLTKENIAEVVWQEEPYTSLWVRNSTGSLKGVIFQRADKVTAWHQHTLGGTDVSVDSIASLRTATEDELWLIVQRTIDSATVQYIEYLESEFYLNDKEDAFFVDCGATYSGAAATVISGLDHLEGETVEVMADGAATPQKTVSSGSITLSNAATKVHVGLPYTSTLRTQTPVGGNRRGSSQGRIARIHEVALRFLETNGGKAGYNVNNLTEVLFNEGQVLGEGPDLFTGTKVVKVNSGNQVDPTVTVQSSSSLPLTLCAITADLSVSET